ncbi:23S rRNA (uracil(1939)-C(5))-methyltransferase RlmD [Vampirovibrio chlorellavorus]|uniref:23S rRNA (uracil(1939)-C(5))-methyltransferase RlmD n=1 Tax=Vampirovibrio chlorellavorus TaxID=758823 RepID=UPI0026F051DB|nr:23S rRNA (uracil(1939)-C(5))-methyltransferase RlmD [Vampirovibrio chlorellavorus]
MELTIEKLVYGGEGLARTSEGEVIFVPLSAPGDVIEAERMAGRQKPAKASIRQLRSPSAHRVSPACDIFGQCGGCQWQHLSLEAQRDWKQKMVTESLVRLGKLPDVTVAQTLSPATDGWKARNRVQWELVPDAATQSCKLGYHAAESHTVVEFNHCPIIPEPFNQLAQRLRELAQQDPKIAAKRYRVEAFISPDEKMLLVFTGEKNGALYPLAQQLMQDFPALEGVCWVDSQQKDAHPKTIAGQPALQFALSGNQYRVSAGQFFQTSYAGAEVLLQVLDEWLSPSVTSLLDIYAGVGLFSVHRAKRTQRVLAIESSPGAEADALENFALNGITNVAWKTSDARQALRALKEDFEVAIIDPPRGGCQPEVLDWLSEHIEKQLIYVSCNPTTLARDLKHLVAQGWKIDAVQPVDMFPQTYHVETLVNLSR